MAMRTGIEQWLLKIWYCRPRPPWYLRMLVPVYRAGFWFDHRNSNNETVAAVDAAPLVVVGNITAGGNGKTPLVIALSKLANDLHLSVGIATTGYGRQSNETIQVQADSDPVLCGDEPVLLSIRSGATVVVAKRRAEAIAELNKIGVDLIISDDGLQTSGLKRDLEICVVDGARGLGNGHLLPAGPLREPQARLYDVSCVISNGHWSGQPTDLDSHLMTLAGSSMHSLDGSRSLTADDFFQQERGNPIHAVAGIGNPDRFFMTLQQLESSHAVAATVDWQKHSFADHHAYVETDFEGINGFGAIVMTEKDAVKCRKLGLENAWYLPVDAELSEAFKDWFRQQILQLRVGKA